MSPRHVYHPQQILLLSGVGVRSKGTGSGSVGESPSGRRNNSRTKILSPKSARRRDAAVKADTAVNTNASAEPSGSASPAVTSHANPNTPLTSAQDASAGDGASMAVSSDVQLGAVQSQPAVSSNPDATDGVVEFLDNVIGSTPGSTVGIKGVAPHTMGPEPVNYPLPRTDDYSLSQVISNHAPSECHVSTQCVSPMPLDHGSSEREMHSALLQSPCIAVAAPFIRDFNVSSDPDPSQSLFTSQRLQQHRPHIPHEREAQILHNLQRGHSGAHVVCAYAALSSAPTVGPPHLVPLGHDAGLQLIPMGVTQVHTPPASIEESDSELSRSVSQYSISSTESGSAASVYSSMSHTSGLSVGATRAYLAAPARWDGRGSPMLLYVSMYVGEALCTKGSFPVSIFLLSAY